MISAPAQRQATWHTRLRVIPRTEKYANTTLMPLVAVTPPLKIAKAHQPILAILPFADDIFAAVVAGRKHNERHNGYER